MSWLVSEAHAANPLPLSQAVAPTYCSTSFRYKGYSKTDTSLTNPDEPRRSGRATKGQHTKNDDLHETQPLKKGKGKPKATKKDVETEDEEEDENATIRCICEVQEDIEGMMMICCDKCEAWQHNVCMGITEVKAELPKQYFCEACRPQNHKELLDDIQAGAKPEEVAARRREERKKKGKKGKTVKKAKVTKQSKAPEVKSEADSEVATPVTQSNIEESIETKNQVRWCIPTSMCA